jgi:predicted N-acetyltransferase YhbS
VECGIATLHAGRMLIRREVSADADPVRDVHAAAFARSDQPGAVPIEVGLVDALRADQGWIPPLSMVAVGSESVDDELVHPRAEQPVAV